MYIPILPVPKPRMTKRDAWAHRPIVDRYFAYCDALRLGYTSTLPDRVRLTFMMPMPKSWSKKRQLSMIGAPHKQKPDIDNLIKGVFDALCKEDAYIYTVHAEKYWSTEMGVEIEDYEKDLNSF